MRRDATWSTIIGLVILSSGCKSAQNGAALRSNEELQTENPSEEFTSAPFNNGSGCLVDFSAQLERLNNDATKLVADLQSAPDDAAQVYDDVIKLVYRELKPKMAAVYALLKTEIPAGSPWAEQVNLCYDARRISTTVVNQAFYNIKTKLNNLVKRDIDGINRPRGMDVRDRIWNPSGPYAGQTSLYLTYEGPQQPSYSRYVTDLAPGAEPSLSLNPQFSSQMPNGPVEQRMQNRTCIDTFRMHGKNMWQMGLQLNADLTPFGAAYANTVNALSRHMPDIAKVIVLSYMNMPSTSDLSNYIDPCYDLRQVSRKQVNPSWYLVKDTIGAEIGRDTDANRRLNVRDRIWLPKGPNASRNSLYKAYMGPGSTPSEGSMAYFVANLATPVEPIVTFGGFGN